MDGQGNISAVNTFGPTGLLSRHSATGSTFYTFDAQGSVAQRLNSSGSVLSSSVYDSFGNKVSTEAQSDPWGYNAQSGYYTDAETGLILCTHRYYDPSQGRWLNRDPIGYAGGLNLYGYVGNGPLAGLDPLGFYDFTVGGFEFCDEGVADGFKQGFRNGNIASGIISNLPGPLQAVGRIGSAICTVGGVVAGSSIDPTQAALGMRGGVGVGLGPGEGGGGGGSEPPTLAPGPPGMVFRGGKTSPGNWTLKPGQTTLSCWDSVSRPYFNNQKSYVGVPTSEMPGGSLFFSPWHGEGHWDLTPFPGLQDLVKSSSCVTGKL